MSLGDTLLQLFFLFMVLLSLVPALALLFFYASTFRSVCVCVCVCVQFPIRLFSVVP